METTEKRIQELQEMARTHFTLLKPDKEKKDSHTVSFPVYDYYNLIHIVSDLMKLCAIAIENESEFDSSFEENSKIDIAQILKIAIMLLPIDEIEFLDEVKKLLKK